MTKQEYMAMSLSKGLVLQSPYGFRPNGKESTGIFRLVYLTGDLYADIENKTFPEEFIPVCRPLSDLTKPIKHKGEEFVPIVKLAKMIYPNYEWRISRSSLYAVEWNGFMTFEYDNGYNVFLCDDSAQLDQLQCFLKIISWHFNLMDEGEEFVDVNTLEFNPYE